MVRAQLPRIVVGLDDQGLADGAVHVAIGLSVALDAQLELIHAVPALPLAWPDLPPDRSMERTEQLLQSARQAALEHVRKLLKQERLASHEPEELVHVLQGSPAEVLLAEAA